MFKFIASPDLLLLLIIQFPMGVYQLMVQFSNIHRPNIGKFANILNYLCTTQKFKILYKFALQEWKIFVHFPNLLKISSKRGILTGEEFAMFTILECSCSHVLLGHHASQPSSYLL